MRILFMGTPDFALFSLRALVENKYDIAAVVTQPDKPRGRGYALLPPPVKVYAVEQGIPVYQPATLRGEEFAALLEALCPDLIIVVAYGKILPENVLAYPRLGCINVHGSLLPAYRGAAPMQRAIMDGCKQTGITTMYMDTGLDTGDMLLRETVAIEENDTFETVHDKMGECGARVLLQTLAQLEAGTLTGVAQAEEGVSYAAKIQKEDCILDFTRPAAFLHNQIRGLSPVPLAVTHTPDGKLLKIITSRIEHGSHTDRAPGTVLEPKEGCIRVACGDGSILRILRVLPEGKKQMNASDFLNGRKLCAGDRLL